MLLSQTCVSQQDSLCRSFSFQKFQLLLDELNMSKRSFHRCVLHQTAFEAFFSFRVPPPENQTETGKSSTCSWWMQKFQGNADFRKKAAACRGVLGRGVFFNSWLQEGVLYLFIFDKLWKNSWREELSGAAAHCKDTRESGDVRREVWRMFWLIMDVEVIMGLRHN